MSRRTPAAVPSPGEMPFSLRPRPVHPRELNRDDLADVLSRIDVLDSILFTVSSDPASINTEGEFFAGLAQISESVANDIRHMMDEDVEFDRVQGGAR